jgi:hypothetical protein
MVRRLRRIKVLVQFDEPAPISRGGWSYGVGWHEFSKDRTRLFFPVTLFLPALWPELWFGKRSGLQYPVESQDLSESSAPIILVPIRRGEEHGHAFGVFDLNRISAVAGPPWHGA